MADVCDANVELFLCLVLVQAFLVFAPWHINPSLSGSQTAAAISEKAEEGYGGNLRLNLIEPFFALMKTDEGY